MLQQNIIEYLSPWAFLRESQIHFGGVVGASQMVDFIEGIEFVDFITDFDIYSIVDGVALSSADPVIKPQLPDVILVSAPTHIISEYQPG